MLQKVFGRLTGELPRETARYVVAGTAVTLLNFISFTVLRRALHVDGRAANAVSIGIAILFAYAANKWFVFRRRADSKREAAADFTKFVGGRLVTMLAEYWGYIFFAWMLVGRGGPASPGDWRELTAKAAIQVFVFAANYLISKFIVFGKWRGDN